MNSPSTSIRLIDSDDAEVLAEQLALDADANVHWDPTRPAEYYMVDGQRRRIEQLLSDHSEGKVWPAVVLSDGLVIGQVTVSEIVRSAFQKANLGFWIVSTHQGRGHAKSAVAQVLKLLANESELHRIEASTQVDNFASQQVLRVNGFKQFGLAQSYIFTNGAWRDSILWERLL